MKLDIGYRKKYAIWTVNGTGSEIRNVKNTVNLDRVIEYHIGKETYQIDEFDDQLDFIREIYKNVEFITCLIEFYDKVKIVVIHNIKNLEYHCMYEPSYSEKKFLEAKDEVNTVVEDNEDVESRDITSKRVEYEYNNKMYCIEGLETPYTEWIKDSNVIRESLKHKRKKKIGKALLQK